MPISPIGKGFLDKPYGIPTAKNIFVIKSPEYLQSASIFSNEHSRDRGNGAEDCREDRAKTDVQEGNKRTLPSAGVQGFVVFVIVFCIGIAAFIQSINADANGVYPKDENRNEDQK